jgi:Kef-type K+ transport system membrane component KefB
MSSLLEIAVVLAAAHLLGVVFRWFGQPRVVGEMTAGILLGPSLLGWIVELVVLNIGLDRRIISPTLFSMMVLMALVTTVHDHAAAGPH